MVDTVRVGELVIDYGILPRGGVNFAHVDNLKNAALAGASFPPIVAERSTKRVVDGLHRHTMYKQPVTCSGQFGASNLGLGSPVSI